jgi:hypothetical protein
MQYRPKFPAQEESLLVSQAMGGEVVARDFSGDSSNQPPSVNLIERAIRLQNTIDFIKQANESNGIIEGMRVQGPTGDLCVKYGSSVGTVADGAKKSAPRSFSQARVEFAGAFGTEQIVDAGFVSAAEANAGTDRSFLLFWRKFGPPLQHKEGEQQWTKLQRDINLFKTAVSREVEQGPLNA